MDSKLPSRMTSLSNWLTHWFITGEVGFFKFELSFMGIKKKNAPFQAEFAKI